MAARRFMLAETANEPKVALKPGTRTHMWGALPTSPSTEEVDF
jgi:hypothetical protein